jgi:hypothetical protein
VTDRKTLDQMTSDDLDQLHERLEAAEDLAEQHARNTLTVARERDSYRKAWKAEQQRRARAEHATDGELRRQLDAAIRALGASETELARLRADIAACRNQQWPQRLGQAEKALNRVRRLAEFTRDHAAPAQDDMALAQHELACAVLDALTEPKEPTP